MYKYSIIQNSKGFKYLIIKGKKLLEKSSYYREKELCIFDAKIALNIYENNHISEKLYSFWNKVNH